MNPKFIAAGMVLEICCHAVNTFLVTPLSNLSSSKHFHVGLRKMCNIAVYGGVGLYCVVHPRLFQVSVG